MLPRLPCGERIHVSIPNNGINERGQSALIEYLAKLQPIIDVLPWDELLRDKGFSYCLVNARDYCPPVNYGAVEDFLDSVGWEWLWKTSRGTLPKRMGSLFHKLGAKLPSDALAQVGNIAATHTEKRTEHVLDFTQHLDWSAGDYGDSGSCFWGGRRYARTMLADLGAYALRFYDPRDELRGVARSWLVPCYDHPDGEFFMLFNAYSVGDYSYDALTQARILAFYLGLSYRKCPSLRNNNFCDNVLYINGGTGLSVGVPEIVAGVTAYDFGAAEDNHRCDEDEDEYTCCACGSELNEDNQYCAGDGDDDSYCETCFHERYFSCDRCGNYVWREDGEYTIFTDSGAVYCGRCAGMYANYCEKCGENFQYEGSGRCAPGDYDGWYCESCYDERFTPCDGCNDDYDHDDLTSAPDDCLYCSECYAERFAECGVCGDVFARMGASGDVCGDCREVDEDNDEEEVSAPHASESEQAAACLAV